MVGTLELPAQKPLVRTSISSHRKKGSTPCYHACHVDVVMDAFASDLQTARLFPASDYNELVDKKLGDAAVLRDVKPTSATKVAVGTMDMMGAIERRVLPYGEGSDERTGALVVRFKFLADRKGDIIDEATAKDAINGALTGVIDCMHSAFDEIVKRVSEAEGFERRVRNANSVLTHLVRLAREKARDVVRYEQRRAALEAEYEAEKQVQADKLADEYLAKTDHKFADGTPIDLRCVAAAAKKLSDAVKGGEGIFQTNETKVDEEDVR